MSGQYKTVLAALQINTYHVEEKVRTRRTTNQNNMYVCGMLLQRTRTLQFKSQVLCNLTGTAGF